LQELTSPFYFSCNKIAGFAHATPPPTKVMMSAILNGGYKVSRSHALSGSIKTDAPRSFIFDVVREWIKTHPVRMDKVSDNSPTRHLLAKVMTYVPHPHIYQSGR
jgi:tRNA (guanine26-N2/guanine27-N2)-dimethyltransferase